MDKYEKSIYFNNTLIGLVIGLSIGKASIAEYAVYFRNIFR